MHSKFIFFSFPILVCIISHSILFLFVFATALLSSEIDRNPSNLIDCMLHIPLDVHHVVLHRSNWFLTRTHLRQLHRVDCLVDHSNRLWYACPGVRSHVSPIVYPVVRGKAAEHRRMRNGTDKKEIELGKSDWNINAVGTQNLHALQFSWKKSQRNTQTQFRREKRVRELNRTKKKVTSRLRNNALWTDTRAR